MAGCRANTANSLTSGWPSITIGPASVTLRNEVRSGNNFTASFKTQPGVSYVVEYTDSLHNPITWQTVTTITGDGTIKSFTDTSATAQRMYRVRTP